MRKKIAASYWLEEDEVFFAAARGFGRGPEPYFCYLDSIILAAGEGGNVVGRRSRRKNDRRVVRLLGMFHREGLGRHCGGACCSLFSSSFPGRAPTSVSVATYTPLGFLRDPRSPHTVLPTRQQGLSGRSRRSMRKTQQGLSPGCLYIQCQ